MAQRGPNPGPVPLVQRHVLEKPSRPILVFDRISGHLQALEDGMRQTLERIKERVEAGG